MGTIQASVWDVTSADGLPPNIEPGSIDIVILVFVLSALHPDEWGRAISNIFKVSSFLNYLTRAINVNFLAIDAEARGTCGVS